MDHLRGLIFELINMLMQSDLSTVILTQPGTGGSGGRAGTCQLDEGEQIIIVQGGAHGYIDRLEFITSKGKVCGPYGGRGGDAFVSSFPGCFLSYISGASHNYIDSLTFHWECPDVDS